MTPTDFSSSLSSWSFTCSGTTLSAKRYISFQSGPACIVVLPFCRSRRAQTTKGRAHPPPHSGWLTRPGQVVVWIVCAVEPRLSHVHGEQGRYSIRESSK